MLFFGDFPPFLLRFIYITLWSFSVRGSHEVERLGMWVGWIFMGCSDDSVAFGDRGLC